MSDTDYKRLWKNADEEAKKLANLLYEANRRIETQAKIIQDIRDGVITKEQLDAVRADLLVERLNKNG